MKIHSPNMAGGAIAKLGWQTAKIEKAGIDNVKKHLSRLEPDDWNAAMIKRLEDIEAGKLQPTDFDKRFYTHELNEFNRYKELGYEATHYSQIQKMFGKIPMQQHLRIISYMK
ncbi:MAG TPA: hypothetical protein VIM65_12760 [Cyclobacteriaceae bacterium]